VLAKPVEARLKRILWETAAEQRAEVLEPEVLPDHEHLLLEVDPQCGIHRLARRPNGRARRWVWNWALAQRQEHYRETGKNLPLAELSRRLTAWKQQPETRWLQDIDSQARQQVLSDLQRAYQSFFRKRACFPRFRSRKRTRPDSAFPSA
jgi:REP element-mobilizing transposase RayT